MPEQLIHQLISRLGADCVLTDPAECCAYSYDNSQHSIMPMAVIFAKTEAEIIDIMQLARAAQVPITVRGRGTGTTGAAVASPGGIVLSLERMDKIVKIDPANRVMIVEPGVLNQSIQEAAAAHGFFWAPDPSSRASCSVGGNLACNAAGPRALKYGTCRENTLGLSAVTGSATAIKTGAYTTKSVVGYDLTRLIIGSEGTLAIITEATLKLTPLPEAKTTLQAIYGDMRTASQAVADLMAQPIIPSGLEFLDLGAIEILQKHGDYQFPQGAEALLIIEIDGMQSALVEATAKISKVLQNPGLLQLVQAQNAEAVRAIWQMRKSLSPILRTVAPKKRNEDVVVPVANMPEFITGVRELAQRFTLSIVNFGHAGNGNIHVNILTDPQDQAAENRADQCLGEIFALVLRLNGSLSGEHGVGMAKRDYIAEEIKPTTLALMRQIKAIFDPDNLLNPDKCLPQA